MEEKIALVTGAARGIGSQIAKTLAKKNIFVVVNYSGSKEKAEQTAEEIINAGGKAVVYFRFLCHRRYGQRNRKAIWTAGYSHQ